MSDEQQQEYIILNESQQMAIVGHCLGDLAFLRNCSKSMTQGHLQSSKIAGLFGMVLGWHKEYNRQPTVYEIHAELQRKYTNLSDLSSRQALLGQCLEEAKKHPEDHLATLISGWIKVVLQRNGIVKSGKLFDSGDYIKAGKVIDQLSRDLKDASFSETEQVDVGDIEGVIKSLSKKKERSCTLGHPMFDELVFEGAIIPSGTEGDLSSQTRGCLSPGESTVLIGPVNSGKSTAVATIAVANMIIGKKVCFIACEEAYDKATIRFAKCYSQLPGSTLDSNTPDAESAKAAWREHVSKNLSYYDWVRPGKMYIEDVVTTIQNAQCEALKHGKGFDLVIVDYPGLLHSREFGQKKDAWEEKAYIYQQMRLLAISENFHALCPIQTNREGFKLNASGAGLLDMGDIAQGFGISTYADNVITINRNAEDHTFRRIKFFVAKTRSGEARRTFMSEVRYDLGTTHGLNYGCKIFKASDIKNMHDEEFVIRGFVRKHKLPTDVAQDNQAYNMAEPMPPDKKQEKQLEQNVQLQGPIIHIPVDKKSSNWSNAVPGED